MKKRSILKYITVIIALLFTFALTAHADAGDIGGNADYGYDYDYDYDYDGGDYDYDDDYDDDYNGGGYVVHDSGSGNSDSSGGGAVTVKMSGKKELTAISIKPEAVDPDDVEMLEDLILAAVNEVIKKVDTMSASKMNSITGGLNIPGMF